MALIKSLLLSLICVSIIRVFVSFSQCGIRQNVALPSRTLTLTNSSNFGTSSSPRKARILLYVTTHASSEQIAFVTNCWPYLVQNTPLLSQADILIFSTAPSADASQKLLREYERVFAEYSPEQKSHHNITLYHYSGESYRRHIAAIEDLSAKQDGANMAVMVGAKQNFFETYDWVIRINPDVLIYDDKFIMEIIETDPNAKGIFVNCHDAASNRSGNRHSDVWPEHVHSDFFVVKSHYLRPFEFGYSLTSQVKAEQIAHDYFKPIYDTEGDRWLPDTGPHNGTCRTGTQKKMGSPVVHAHELLQTCPQVTAAVGGGSSRAQ